MTATRREQAERILARRLQRDAQGRPVCYPSFSEAARRIADERLRIYLGVDPTSPHLHFGHTVPLLLLKELAGLGHEAIVLLGDFTAQVGDPTDKAAARKSLGAAEVKQNMKTYLAQISRIIPKRAFKVEHNSRWLAKMRFGDVMDIASRATVQQMISREMFQERIKAERPVYVSEFLYPLLQGFDSVAMDVDAEIGGNDQTFNMLVGRDLLRQIKNKDKLVLTTRLLVDASSGRKFSKTEGGLVAIDDRPEVIFEKVSRSIPDAMVQTVFELCTEVPLEEIHEMHRRAESGSYRDFNLALAEELVRMYHGDEAAASARAAYHEAVKGRVVPDEEAVPVASERGASMTRVLADALRVSRSEAKRLIEQRAVTRNGELVTDALGPSGIKDGDVLRVGSHRPFRIRIEK